MQNQPKFSGPSFNCDFESVNGLCPGWKQSKTDDFDWTLKKGPTPSGLDGSTGPANDHTHKNSGQEKTALRDDSV